MPDDPPIELHDIRSAEPFLDGFWLPWWGWALVGLLTLLLVGGVLAWWFQPRPAKTADPEEAFRDSQRDLEQLRTKLENLPLAEAATGVSLALRRYLVALTGDPALYETREEFVGRSDALAKLPDSDRADTADFFDELSRLKYSPASANPAIVSALLDRGETLLRQLRASLSPAR